MVAFFIAPFYILLNIYVYVWLLRWMKACSKHFKKTWVQAILMSIYGFLALSLLIAFFLPFRWIKTLANIWFGSILYIVLIIAVVDLLRVILKRVVKVSEKKLSSRRLFVSVGALCITAILSISVYGAVNAGVIRTTHYDVSVDKDTKLKSPLRIVLVADLHLGYNRGYSLMKQMVKKINAQDPDLVIVAGDIFDNSFKAVEKPEETAEVLRGIKSKYGVYGCLGNHDVEEKILAGFTFNQDEKKQASEEMYQFIEDSGITLLQDKGATIADSIYLYGRADMHRPGKGIDKRKSPDEITKNIDKDKPIFIIDHEPAELDELSGAGVDLDLAGHTHDGQMFPGNLTINLFWENPYGLMKKGDMTNITTSGVGVFGPNMRVGTKSEIVTIDVSFK